MAINKVQIQSSEMATKTDNAKAPTLSKNEIANTFRRWGYLQAEIDSLGRMEPFPHAELDALNDDTSRHFRQVYCGAVGAEFMHMPYPDRCAWVAQKMEAPHPAVDQNRVFKRILAAELFEKFIHTRYVGTKRFSLEGSVVLIPLLDQILDTAANSGVEIVMIAMAHRGRLTTLQLIAGTSAANLFAGFEDVDPRSVLGSGDVKYHKGATGTYTTWSGKTLNIHLASNPSHLEVVNPVLMGRARAREERLGDTKHEKVLTVLIHGDAAFAGQGVTAESLNFMSLPGFSVGGTIHVIVNNLIGFTATPKALHSSRFASDIAKRIPVPIFHVNGDAPNEVVRVGEIAAEYRTEFKTDVVIDLIGYRRFGHSEVDDPTTTSPVLYEKINKLPQLYQSYAERSGISADAVKEAEEKIIEDLKGEQERGRGMNKQPTLFALPDYWSKYYGGMYSESYEVDTRVSRERLLVLTERLTTYPEGFSVHPKIKKLLEDRLEMGRGNKSFDWGMGEALACASLLWDGTPVRIVGQDSRRGTFNHRHALMVDTKTGAEYFPLCNLKQGQARFDVYDSQLSEAAALGFEYGFSRDYPEALVCWEAQFGDFANGAQTVVDQFISAAEDKWHLLSGLVMLLPHGYEGQGPEHSSARVERYLQLCAKDNMQVAQPSTAAQNFHLLRRQVLREWRKPLIVFTPKSMLRLPAASSPISELSDGYFHNVLDDKPKADGSGYESATRLLLCTGKIVHELRAQRDKRGADDVAIVTIEQLYPFPEEELRAILKKYTEVKTIVWVQDEPANMGALFFVRPHLERLAGTRTVRSVKRSESGSPATGSAKAHELEQQALYRLAFAAF